MMISILRVTACTRNETAVSNKDLRIVRDLAKEVAEIAALPIQAERIRLWKACNRLTPERPMVLATQQPQGELDAAWTECECEDALYHAYEEKLRRIIMHHERIPCTINIIIARGFS